MGIITDIFVATEAADIPIVWDVLAIAKKILINRRPINKLAENQLFDVSSDKCIDSEFKQNPKRAAIK
jgi:hypothetical protein